MSRARFHARSPNQDRDGLRSHLTLLILLFAMGLNSVVGALEPKAIFRVKRSSPLPWLGEKETLVGDVFPLKAKYRKRRYPESLTDPSYRGQILVFTQPLIGVSTKIPIVVYVLK